jgi:hypothetical protein
VIPTGSSDSLGDADLSHFLEGYRQEVLRWNSQFSLISRVEPERRLSLLVEQCLSALRELPAALGDLDAEAAAALRFGNSGIGSPSGVRRLCLVDIGSGAGLPGLVWHRILWERAGVAGPAPVSWLIEPRGQRAWFLERCIDLFGLLGIRALAAPWGEARLGPEGEGIAPKDGAAQPAVRSESPPEPVWLLTLMALRLSDRDIVRGWRAFVGGRDPLPGERLVVLRLRSGPPRSEVPDELALPDRASWRWVPCGRSSRPSSLIVSLHGGR